MDPQKIRPLRARLEKAKVNREINHDKRKYEVKFEITQYTQVELGEVEIPLVNNLHLQTVFVCVRHFLCILALQTLFLCVRYFLLILALSFPVHTI